MLRLWRGGLSKRVPALPVSPQSPISAQRLASGSRGLPANHYATLGIHPSATATEVKEAYVRLVRRHHPDLLPTTARTDERDAAHQSLVEVNAAFAVLGTEASRRLYDVQRSGPVGMQVNARGYAGTYREGPASAPHVDKDGFDNQGFYHGSHKRQRERMFSDTTVVVAVVMWMVAGIVIHFWRFGEAHAAVTEYVTEENRKASSQLAKAKQRAQENGPQLQLAMLRDQHSGGSNPAVQSAPANHSTTTCASDVL